MKKKEAEKQNTTRLAIIDPEICKPDQCNLECKRCCPVNKIGKKCIEVIRTSKISLISEALCIGCGACVKKCPFNAIKIINIPTNLTKEVTHRYGENAFKLHRLPIPKLGQVIGLVGTNGIGKSTCLDILSNRLRPNLGRILDSPDWVEVLDSFKGSELHGYVSKLLGNEIVPSIKTQYIYAVPDQIKKDMRKKEVNVLEVIKHYNVSGDLEELMRKFSLRTVKERSLDDLSGGELQRLVCLITCLKKADTYFFDEPTSFLDVKQRLAIASNIRDTSNESNYVVVVEHDLAILDLMCDFGCVLYGKSGAYGVVTKPFTIKNAINIFLDGFIPNENMRFRAVSLKFNVSERPEKFDDTREQFSYPFLTKTYATVNKENKIPKICTKEVDANKNDEKKSNARITEDANLGMKMKNLSINDAENFSFKLEINEGVFNRSEIIVFLGENGMGKTTFVALIAGLISPNGSEKFPELSVSVKPQRLSPKFKGTVKDLLMTKIRVRFLDSYFINEVIKPLNIEYLYDTPVTKLSGGELQRIAIIMCLGKAADIYLLDEPSAWLDSDQRLIIAKVIKRFIYQTNTTAFIVEHDLIVGTYLADKVVVFEGEPGRFAKASKPMDLEEGMNIFLKSLNVTFRRDPTNHRPRVNKLNSAKDREQKESNKWFFA